MIASDLAKVLAAADPRSELAVSTPTGTYVVQSVVIDVNTPGIILICVSPADE